MDPKQTLHEYLRTQRTALLSKTDGLGEHDLRRPLTPTGTNLLGLVKHVASIQLGYLGDCFGRPSGIALPWYAPDADPDADLFATADESTADLLDLFARSAAHGDATIEALDLDTVGEVPWWGPRRRRPTLHTVLVHLLVDVARHAGHADILREQVDGVVGYAPGNDNLSERSPQGWVAHHDRVEAEARRAAGLV